MALAVAGEEGSPPTAHRSSPSTSAATRTCGTTRGRTETSSSSTGATGISPSPDLLPLPPPPPPLQAPSPWSLASPSPPTSPPGSATARATPPPTAAASSLPCSACSAARGRYRPVTRGTLPCRSTTRPRPPSPQRRAEAGLQSLTFESPERTWGRDREEKKNRVVITETKKRHNRRLQIRHLALESSPKRIAY